MIPIDHMMMRLFELKWILPHTISLQYRVPGQRLEPRLVKVTPLLDFRAKRQAFAAQIRDKGQMLGRAAARRPG